jgi:hypothetical protein
MILHRTWARMMMRSRPLTWRRLLPIGNIEATFEVAFEVEFLLLVNEGIKDIIGQAWAISSMQMQLQQRRIRTLFSSSDCTMEHG